MRNMYIVDVSSHHHLCWYVLCVQEKAINIMGETAAKDKGFGRTAMSSTVFSGNLEAVKLVVRL